MQVRCVKSAVRYNLCSMAATSTKNSQNNVMGPTKIEKAIIEAIKTAKLGLPDWSAVAKDQHISLDYLMNRVDWMRRMGMIR